MPKFLPAIIANMSQFDRYGSSGGLGRTAAIAGSVVLFHAAGLYLLQSGLLRQAVEVIVPAQVLSEFITPPPPPPPEPEPEPEPPPPPPPKPRPQPPKPRPAPMPAAIPDPTPALNAPVGVIEPPPPPPILAPVEPTAPPAPPEPPAPAIVLPSTNAGHLNNPKPKYPSISRRLGEQGVVMLSVLIGADGLPKEVKVKTSSGFERLDRQAAETVQRWRFMPGTKNGVPTAMWYQQPIHFSLNR